MMKFLPSVLLGQIFIWAGQIFVGVWSTFQGFFLQVSTKSDSGEGIGIIRQLLPKSTQPNVQLHREWHFMYKSILQFTQFLKISTCYLPFWLERILLFIFVEFLQVNELKQEMDKLKSKYLRKRTMCYQRPVSFDYKINFLEPSFSTA